MKGKKLLCIVLSLAAVVSLLLMRDSVAWFNTDSGEPASGRIVVDKMAFSFDGMLGSYLQYANGTKYIVTDQNLIVTNGGRITVTNYSNIATEARIKITYATPSDANRVYRAVANGSNPDSLSVKLDSHWVLSGDYFEYWSAVPDPNGATAEAQAGTKGFAAVSAGSSTTVSAINEILYLDELFQRDNNGELVTNQQGDYIDLLNHADYFTNNTPLSGAVHVTFEAKQADRVDWTQIASWSTT